MSERGGGREDGLEEKGGEGKGVVDAKIASSVELLSGKLWILGERWVRKGESREKASGVQGHALSQIINFSP